MPIVEVYSVAKPSIDCSACRRDPLDVLRRMGLIEGEICPILAIHLTRAGGRLGGEILAELLQAWIFTEQR